MQQFIIVGVDKLTDREVEHRIEAADQGEAQAVANGIAEAVEVVESVGALRQHCADAGLDDRLRRIGDAIDVNGKSACAIALDSAET